MIVFASIYRIFKTSVLHMVRNFSHSLAAVLVMSLTLFLIAVFVLLMFGMNIILSYFESKPQVTAFFKDEATEEQIMIIKEKLEQTGEVSEIKYISKDEALDRFKEQNKTEPLLLEMVTANILPASLEVSATDVIYLAHLADILVNEELVEEVIYQEDVVETLRRWTGAVRIGGVVLASVFIVASVLIVLVTISMNIANRAEEIEIMRLVGASSSYIRWPFIIEGIIYGILSGIIGVGVIFLLFPRIQGPLANFLAGIPIFPLPKDIFINLLLGEIGLGAMIGVIGSTIAVTRRLRV